MNSENVHIVPPCQEDVDIIYEDDHLLFVNKPSGLLSVPGKHPLNRDCVINRLQIDYPHARIVHRLDLDTSGIMVIALGAASHKQLSLQFQNRETEKHYEAILYGTLEHDTGSIDFPLICDWPNRPKQKVDTENGKPALTHYRVIERMENSTRVLFTPITGRSHQLRVHAAAIQHPILGCDFYAHAQALSGAPRLQLHATYLKLTHPEHLESIDATCPAPF